MEESSAIYVYTGDEDEMMMTEEENMNGIIPQDIQQVIVASHVQLLHPKAFQNCSLLVSVSLPFGLKVIGERAFASCMYRPHDDFHSLIVRQCHSLWCL